MFYSLNTCVIAVIGYFGVKEAIQKPVPQIAESNYH